MNTISKTIEHEKQNMIPLKKIYDPDLIPVNIEDGWVEIEKINEIDEIQQTNEVEIEIITTMMEKGLIHQSQTSTGI